MMQSTGAQIRLGCWTAVLLSGMAAFAEDPTAARPNILVIVSDDQGYADAGFQGSQEIPTPNLDRLAHEGIRCTSGYVSHPFCSPTRAGLMTGRYQQRFGHERNPFFDPTDHREGLPTSERLLPAFLKDAGYVTGWVGKWHLGAAPEFSPMNRGFQETFGFIGGGHDYRDWKVNPASEYQVPIERNGQPVAPKEHLTAVFGNEASAFIQRHVSEPWFLYLAFNAPHAPHQPTAERLAKFKSIKDPKRRAYAAQVSLMDDAIGEALEMLRATGQERNTLVFFFSDNGGPSSSNGSSNGALRGEKGQVYEGGVRVPFIVSWPGRLPADTYDKPVSSLDVFATALMLAGISMPTDREYDSVDLLPFLRGEKGGVPHAELFWRSGTQWAVRAGSLKLVRHESMPDELYDLSVDLAESRNLASERVEDARRLGAALDVWNKKLIPPAFPGLDRGHDARKSKP